MEAAQERMSELVRVLQARSFASPPKDYHAGKTALRNELMSHYRVSRNEAARIIDRMEGLGYLRFEPGAGSSDRGVWRMHDLERSHAITV
jgi:hypothetical protein